MRKRIIFNFSIKLGSNVFAKVKFLCFVVLYGGFFFYIILGSIISYLISNKWQKRIKKSLKNTQSVKIAALKTLNIDPV